MFPNEAKPPGRRGRRIDNINALRRRAGDHVLPQFAGYMEGAVRSGFEAARACLTRFL
jgi:monoamine oxidase